MIALSELCDGTITPRYSNKNMAHIAAAIKERLPQAHDQMRLSLGDIAMLPTEYWPTREVWEVANSLLLSKRLTYQDKCKIAHILTTSLDRCAYWIEAQESTKYLTRHVYANLRGATYGIAVLLSDDPKDHRRRNIVSTSRLIKGVICLHHDEARKQALKQDELERLHIIREFPPLVLSAVLAGGKKDE